MKCKNLQNTEVIGKVIEDCQSSKSLEEIRSITVCLKQEVLNKLKKTWINVGNAKEVVSSKIKLCVI